jgi:hypothetical protein
MYVAKVGTDLNGMADAINEAWLEESNDPTTAIDIVGSCLMVKTSREGLPVDWDPASLRLTVERAIHRVLQGCVIEWKS